MPDYSKGKIYTIRCRNNPDHIYVGSTIQPLSKRWGGHKCHSRGHPGYLLYSTIGDNCDDWYIELHEIFPCETKEQLCKREGQVIREIGTLNKNIAGQSRKEYRQQNADKIKEYRQQNADKLKEYRQQNADKLKEKRNKYYQANADKIKEKMKEYDQQNADKIKEKKKEYYRQNTDKFKEYRQQNTDKIKEYRKEYYQRKKLEKQQITAVTEKND